jgi:hypothetical protein
MDEDISAAIFAARPPPLVRRGLGYGYLIRISAKKGAAVL